MIPLPDSLVATELGAQIQRAEIIIEEWIDEYHRLAGVIWEECESRGWPCLEMTYPFGKICPEIDTGEILDLLTNAITWELDKRSETPSFNPDENLIGHMEQSQKVDPEALPPEPKPVGKWRK